MESALKEWYELHKLHLYSGSYETKDLANFLGISPRTVQRWLKDKASPSKEELKIIKEYLQKKARESIPKD